MTTETTTTTASSPKPAVRYHGLTHYSVSSRTRAGHTHHVNTLNLTCSCEAGRAGRRCWAIAVALQYEAWRKREEAKARAARAAERAQAANWSSAPPQAAQSAQLPATGSVAPPVRQTGDLLPLSRWFE